MKMITSGDFNRPELLSERGKSAWCAIFGTLLESDPTMSSGGCKVFRSPEEHLVQRGEKYGKGSALIVVYDGGDHRRFFNLDEGDYAAVERMQEALEKAGFYFEECTGWYGAVYEI